MNIDALTRKIHSNYKKKVAARKNKVVADRKPKGDRKLAQFSKACREKM